MLEGIGRFAHARYGFCIVTLCQGKIQDKSFYSFVAVEPQNYSYFRKNYKKGDASHFDAYGQELLRGWGDAPPEDIIEYLRTRHGVEFDVSKQFLERLLAQINTSPFPLKPAAVSEASRALSG